MPVAPPGAPSHDADRMQLEGIPFQSIDWSRITPITHPGAASWRTTEVGNVRVRLVEYSAGYVADHWCGRGHVVFVVHGELVTELSDGRRTDPDGRADVRRRGRRRRASVFEPTRRAPLHRGLS
jgi:hypothetical protein